MKKTLTVENFRIDGLLAPEAGPPTRRSQVLGDGVRIHDYEVISLFSELRDGAKSHGGDVVEFVKRSLGVSEMEAIARLVKLRLAIHDFLRENGIQAWTDNRIAGDLRQLVACLDNSDEVLMNLPNEVVSELAVFHRP